MRIGYKVFSKNMHSMDNDGDKDYEFREDVEYEIPDYANIIFQGFIYYNDLEEVAKFHLLDPAINRIYRIRILGESETIRGIHFSSKIELIREISREEIEVHFDPRIDHIISDNNEQLQICMAQSKLCMRKLVHSNLTNVRAEVARQGYRLDYLIHDVSELVRYEVAAKGYGLDILAKDRSDMVRREVEAQGYDFEKLNYETELMFQEMVNAARAKFRDPVTETE